MLSRIAATGFVIFLVMVAIQQGGLRRAGVTGSCKAMQTLVDHSEWFACKPGRLSGRPSLADGPCASAGLRGKVEWWHCSVRVASSAAAR